MSEELIYLIVKRLTHTIGSEEALLLQNWIESSPEHRRIFDEVSDIWIASAIETQEEFKSSGALEKVKRRLEMIKPEPKAKQRKKYLISISKVAALAFLLIGIGTLGYYAGVTKGKAISDFTFIEAPKGSRTKINLPDGTKVWLNGGSNLKFGATFNRSDRVVTINGEGYFDVSHNKGLPFVVNIGKIRIKVLGTAFNIKAYPDDGMIETILERGSLAIEKLTEEGKTISQTVLEPNQRATFVKTEGKMHLSDIDTKAREKSQKESVIQPVKEQLFITKKIDTQAFTSWKDNKLVFRNEPFESLTIRLERWFGVIIRIEDEEIKRYHFNGTFEKETIHDVLNIIHFAIPIEYTVNQDQVTIRLDKAASKRK